MRLSSFVLFTVVVVVGSSVMACGSGPGGGSGGTGNGSGPEPADVSVEAQCSALTACGGDVEGTWNYTGGCTELDFSSLQAACPGLSVTNTSATVDASVVFAGGNVTRSYTVTGSATVDVPSSCTEVAGGCSGVESAIAGGSTTASCTDDGSGGCTCAVGSTASDDSESTYTVEGNQILTGDGNAYAFCVEGGTMSYSHTSGSSPEQGVFTLAMR
jgi:hypothetical protein